MYGTLSSELEVKAPASLVWKVYGILELTDIVEKQHTDVIDKIEVVQGDGSVGTILKVNFRAGVFAFTYFIDKFTKVDDEKMVKEVEVVEGGYLELGFNRYLVRLEIIKKDEQSSITRSTIEYDIKEEYAANASLASIHNLKAVMNNCCHSCSSQMRLNG